MKHPLLYRNTLLLGLTLFGPSLGLSETLVQNPVPANAQRLSSGTVIKGKKLSIPSVNTLRVPSLPKVSLKDRYQLPRDIAVRLPKMEAGPSPISPVIEKISVPTRLPPLVRFSLKSHWAGKDDARLAAFTLPATVAVPEPTIAVVDPFTDGEFKILESLLLLNAEETTPLAIGLANPLLQLSATRPSAQEILARSFLNLKIRTAAFEHLKDLVKGDPKSPRSQQAVRTYIEHLKPTDYEDAQFLTPFLPQYTSVQQPLGNLPIAQARGALHKKDLELAWEALETVSPQSPQSFEARFLKAMIQYRSNEADKARKSLESLLKDSDRMPKDLRSLGASTLAQIYFQQGDYKKAYQAYRKVDQEHPLWLQTLVETAWSQILNKDYEGAAGNMFSLHTNYFKGAYNPESYIVRTVGYVQLCQFGDAMAVLKDFLRKYKFAQKQLQAYQKTKADPLETIRDFLKAGMPKKHQGLPRSLLVEIARDPKFIELQKKLNEVDDDSSKLSQLNAQLEALDQKFLKAQTQYGELVREIEVAIKKAKKTEEKEALLVDKKKREQQFQRQVLLRKIILDSKLGIKKEYDRFSPLWSQQKTQLKSEQKRVIQASFDAVQKDLQHWLGQSELLFYEIHNGAGEHLRYQMASSEDGKELGTKPGRFKKGDKEQQWAFDGEIWEDEVGHYRSSLKNVCPEEESSKVTEERPLKQNNVAQVAE